MSHSTLLDECRWVWRSLGRSPVPAAAVILSLAIGIGTTSAAFSALNALRFKPLSVPNAGQLYQVVLGSEAASQVPSAVFDYLRGRPETLGRLAAANAGRYRLRVGDVSLPSEVLFVSGDFFDVVDVPARVGRALQPDDDRANTPLVGVLGYHAWLQRFGGAPDAIGATVLVQGTPVTIVGVAPPSFHGVHVGRRFDIALPLAHVRSLMGLQPGALWPVSIVGRRVDDVTLDTLSSRLRSLQPLARQATLPSSWRPESQEGYLAQPLRATAADTGVPTRHSSQATPFTILMLAALVVLAIASVSVAHWLAARQHARQREFAVRAAVGAPHASLLRLVWLEAAAVTSLGAIGGTALAFATTEGLVRAFSSSAGTLELDLRPDWRAAASGAALTLLVAVAGGLAPSRQLAPTTLHTHLALSQGGVRGMRLVTRWLATIQVATLVALICGTSMLARSYRAVTLVDPGFNATGLWVADTLLGDRATDAASKVDAYGRVSDAIGSIPGVAAIGGASISPLAGNALVTLVEVKGTEHPVYLNRITPGYFNALNVPLLAGRDVSVDDRGGQRVAVVNEAFARLIFGTDSPIGASVTRVTLSTNMRVPLQVVGVVGDSAYLTPREPAPATIYVPLTQEPAPDRAISFVVRWHGSSPPAMDALQRAAAVGGAGADVTLAPISAQLARSWATDRVLAMVAAALSVMGLTTSVLGLYGVLSRMVEGRSRELGLRAALGATRAEVVRVVLADAMVIAASGGVLGLALTAMAAPALAATLFGVAPRDLATMTTGVGTLIVTLGLASIVPAWRAARVDPAAALRSE